MRKMLQITWMTLQVLFKIILVVILIPSGFLAMFTIPAFVLTLLFAGGEDTPLSLLGFALGSGLLTFLSWGLLNLPLHVLEVENETGSQPRPEGSKCTKSEPQSRPEGSKRHVYLVSGRGLIKIGISSCPDRRLRKHASQGLTQVHATHEFESEREARALEDEWIARITAVKGDILHDGFTEASFATTAAWTQAQEIWLEHTGKTVPIPFSRRAS